MENRNQSTMDELMTIDELAARLKVQKSFLYSRTRETGPDAIPNIRIGKYIRFNFGDVMKWFQANQ
ncbi:DNA-binding protein [Candidatus Parcubacteria bacterium]|nr:MAG: DNA-binding protein [Candidatus Parcubacteria bacterium]